MVQTPNKVYTCEYKGSNDFNGYSHYVVIVAASSSDVAKQHVKEKIGVDVQPVWLMGAVYPTIYLQDGSKPINVQVKILSNCTAHMFEGKRY